MEFKNPVIPGFHPDPSVCRVGDAYWLVTSSFEYFPGVPVFLSRDLVHWKQIGHCLTRESQLDLRNSPNSGGIYAPTIRHHEGRFYMITTNVQRGNFFVWADDPSGPWSEPVWLEQGGIDPSLFFDDDGRVYMTSNGGGNRRGIYQCEIDIETGRRRTETRFIWAGTGGASPEGPHLYKINGIYYLMIAEGGTEYGHMVTIARSESPWGPFEPCPHNPVLTNRSLKSPIQAVGHADLVQAHDGSWWAVCLGIRPVPYPWRHHLGRETFLCPVRWGEDGWPVFGDGGILRTRAEAPKLPQHRWEEPPARDDFDGPRLAPCWNHIRNPHAENYSLTARKGSLALTGADVTLDECALPTFVGRRQQHFNCLARTRLDFEPAQDGEEAGLTALLNESFHYEIAVKRIGGAKCLIFRRRLASLQKEERIAELPAGPVELEIHADHEMYRFKCIGRDGNAVAAGSGECRMLSTEVGGKFTGVFFGLYATGNGKSCQAAAYFDWFDYIPSEEQWELKEN